MKITHVIVSDDQEDFRIEIEAFEKKGWMAVPESLSICGAGAGGSAIDFRYGVVMQKDSE